MPLTCSFSGPYFFENFTYNYLALPCLGFLLLWEEPNWWPESCCLVVVDYVWWISWILSLGHYQHLFLLDFLPLNFYIKVHLGLRYFYGFLWWTAFVVDIHTWILIKDYFDPILWMHGLLQIILVMKNTPNLNLYCSLFYILYGLFCLIMLLFSLGHVNSISFGGE